MRGGKRGEQGGGRTGARSRNTTVKTKKQFTGGIVELGFVIKQTRQMERRFNDVFIFNFGIAAAGAASSRGAMR